MRVLGTTDVEVHILRSGGCCRGACNERRACGGFACRIAGIPGIDLVAKGDRLVPDCACATGGLLQVARNLLERLRILAIRVDLQQLEMDFVALGRSCQCFLQQFLGLRIAAICKENFRFGYRVDLPGSVC